MLSSHTDIKTINHLAMLYTHEATRVYNDRLVDKMDRGKFYQILADNLHDTFKVRTSLK